MNKDIDRRIEWVEPEVRALDIAETAAVVGGAGPDGETTYTDCSLS